MNLKSPFLNTVSADISNRLAEPLNRYFKFEDLSRSLAKL